MLAVGLNKDYLAEGVGFEPTVRMTYNGFRDRPIRPLSHPSGGEPRRCEGVRFRGCRLGRCGLAATSRLAD
jgi:hypothetical protein